MTRENVMSTPIFDQLLREMAQRVEPRVPAPSAPEHEVVGASADQSRANARRRHRAE